MESEGVARNVQYHMRRSRLSDVCNHSHSEGLP